MCVTDETTAFAFQKGITRWTQKLNQAYEDFYLKNKGRVQGYAAAQWGFPALFEVQVLFLPLSQKRMSRKVTVGPG